MNVKSLLVSVSLALACTAHTIFQQVWVNGVDQGFENGLRLPSYDGPITDVTSAPMSCNGGPNPLLYNSTNVITVPAGATVQGRWGQYLQVGSPSVDPSHKGPIMVYLAPVSNAVTSAPPVNGWFKIYQDGLHSDGTTWAVDTMIANNGLWSFTVPSCIKPGQYLMRGELIALHAASTYPGAQLYMECAQITITGSGTTVPSSTVSFPGAYKSTDPGITFNLYAGAKTYTIPGPAPFTCSGSGGSSPPATSAPATTAPATTAPATTSKPPTSTTSAPSAAQTAYGQCGGQGWAGATTCVSGFTCKVSSAYYSQCLPS